MQIALRHKNDASFYGCTKNIFYADNSTHIKLHKPYLISDTCHTFFCDYEIFYKMHFKEPHPILRSKGVVYK